MRRQELLNAVIADLMNQGLGDRSLRDIASAVGTSHRMLIHHFGSRYGLMTAVVEAIEEDQKRFLESLDGELGDVVQVMWQRVTEPALWPAERLFFECYARALQGEEPFARMLPGAIDDWVDRTVGMTPDLPPAVARARARLGLDVFRGLLLDLVGTGDREGVNAAFETFVELFPETRRDVDGYVRTDSSPAEGATNAARDA
ncbi:MAG TPA: TetR/AcrR family transcriptional regulator [Candidatus Limnocylindrales bacterium]|jgi:AcrR family transcriptional regulator